MDADLPIKTAWFEFAVDLYVYLKPAMQAPFAYPFRNAQTLKHLIEAAGVPHTEVGTVTANGKTVSLNYQPQNGDKIYVQALLQIVIPEPAFILDGHLGRLAAHLRLLGYDTLYRNDYSDNELAHIAAQEKRILLTRDRRLLMRSEVSTGHWVHATAPLAQIQEIIKWYYLGQAQAPFRPFHRCLRCNGLLQPVEKEKILHRLEPLTRLYFHEFNQCQACQQVYWQGSHHTRLKEILDLVNPNAPQ